MAYPEILQKNDRFEVILGEASGVEFPSTKSTFPVNQVSECSYYDGSLSGNPIKRVVIQISGNVYSLISMSDMADFIASVSTTNADLAGTLIYNGSTPIGIKGHLPIDKVDGVAVTTTEDLYNKLLALDLKIKQWVKNTM